MNPNCKKPKYGQLNTVDRFSNLPDFIIYRIFSFLDTKQAYRTSVLSKRWKQILTTNPVLEFHYYCKANNLSSRYWPSKEFSARLLEYMDTRMQRFAKENLLVTTLRLEFPNCNEALGCDVEELSCTVEETDLSRRVELSRKVDEWIQIAVCNQVPVVTLDGPINYQLPDFLLSAKSLTRLVCQRVKIPYYNETINLAPLQTLMLFECIVEEHMLNHIISLCVLLEFLSVKNCSGFKTIAIPTCSRLKELNLSYTLPENRSIILGSSRLTCFKFSDRYFDDGWPVLSKRGSLRNLRILEIGSCGITDEDLHKLLAELASLETLRLSICYSLETFKISSIQLKKFYLSDCCGLVDVTVDAPRMSMFKFKGVFESDRVITISSQASCDLSVHTSPNSLDTEGFLKLKELMTGLKSCNALKISLADFTNESACNDIKFNEELGDVNLGPPRDIRELKLTLYDQSLSASSVSAFLNGLFWLCHPDIISFRVHLKCPSLMIEIMMTEIENMANCWRHPLKRVTVQGVNCSNLFKSKKVDVHLRLHW